MNPRGVLWQAVLAGVGLIAAYLTWQRGPELDSGEVFVLDMTKNDVERIRFEEDKTWAEVVRGKDADGFMVWLRISGHDASDAQLPSGHPYVALKVPDREVRGNEAAKRLFERFAPLRASRALGKLDDKTLASLGLDKSKKHIEVTARGVKRRFVIAPAPPGGTDPYLRSEEDGRVYVVARSILSDLESASVNLTERRFHAFLATELDKVAITAGKKRKELVGRRVEGRADLQLAPASAPDKPDTTAENWHERIFRLFPAEVMGKGEAPASGEPVPALRIEYSSRGQIIGWLEIARGAGSGASELYGRSEFTAGWMKLGADAATLLGEGETLAGS